MTTLSDEQAAFAASVRDVLTKVSPVETTRASMEDESGSDPAAWEQIARTGLAGLHVPERYGGQGSGLFELVLAMQEMGRALFCGPYLSSTGLATTCVLHAGSEDAKRRLLPALAAGTERATLAVTEQAGLDVRKTTARFRSADDRVRVSATCPYVVDGHTADYLVVPARAEADADVTLLLVRKDVPGVERTLLDTVDRTRKLVRVGLTDAPAEVIGDAAADPSSLDRAVDVGTLCLAAESVGGAMHCLDAACEYAKVRTAFGRPIGSFQALKHKAADHYIDIEAARSLTYAAAAADPEGDDFPLLVSLAKAAAGEAYERVAFDSIVMHGGIGFTWEHDAHLYLRRAQSSAKLLGEASDHRHRASARLELG